MTGGLVTILAIWLAGSDALWLALVGAVIGGGLGYAAERRHAGHRGSSRLDRRVETLAAALVLFIFAAIGTTPVTVSPVAGDISTNDAVDHVEFIARDAHAMGSGRIEEVREYLIDRLTDYGLIPERQSVSVPDYFGNQGEAVLVTNVIARIPGTTTGRAILLVAHHDTVPTTPGANDNSAAVAALLEVGRHLAGSPPPHDVILLFTDGEEPTPRYGMSAFTAHPWFEDVELAVNFEGIGSAGPPMLVELSGPSAHLVDRLAATTEKPAAFSFLTKIAQLIGGASTDFDVIREAGVPGYSFAYARGSSIYHTPRDDLESLNVDGMAEQASLALGIATGFGHLDIPPGDAVFFAIPGGRVVLYGGNLAVAGALAAALVLGLIIWERIRGRHSSIRRLFAGVGLTVSGGLVTTAILTLAWYGLAAARSEMGIIENLMWLLLLATAAVGCGHLIWRRAERSGSDIVGGIALIAGLLCLATGIWLAQVSYLFVWPALAAGLAFLVARVADTPSWRLVSLGVVFLPTAIVLIPALDSLSQLATPRPGNPDSDLTGTIAAPLLLTLLAVGLIHLAMASRTAPPRDHRPSQPASGRGLDPAASARS